MWTAFDQKLERLVFDFSGFGPGPSYFFANLEHSGRESRPLYESRPTREPVPDIGRPGGGSYGRCNTRIGGSCAGRKDGFWPLTLHHRVVEILFLGQDVRRHQLQFTPNILYQILGARHGLTP